MDSSNADIGIELGAPCWMDLLSSDIDASVAFYTGLFGWDCQVDPNPEMQGYRYFEKSGKATGGCMRNEPEWGAPDGWSIFLKSLDVRATATAAEKAGGAILMPPMDVEPNGSFTILSDPGGARISAWQPKEEQGFGVLDEDGAASHFELQTPDYDRSVQFYKDVFGVETKAVSEGDFRYTTFGGVDHDSAGIMDSAIFPKGTVPIGWLVYFKTHDIQMALKQVDALGGKCTDGPEDTPYGKLATAIDPTGSVFKLRQV